ncbi:multicopper oxidase family protein [Mycobacterium parmense]|uniref:Multicopper oxidase MmcO n=1 Tax=Mycobacterium parmense TaxID=185642 RepID=A0A7I7Z1H3_9MYCO|nr:multicopper oxidase family protein [Mycobacterium parmense]MCV7352559.1 multicopper oxidase family protein [Mycobacterium parmense]ORW55715.1 oxidase [Mycobacterium parmense]BBZ47719.1 multicopper oxidase MmcO [Mycobacterium parmense]
MPVQPASAFPSGGGLGRREFLAAGIAGGLALAGCGRPDSGNSASSRMAAAIAAAEATRPHSGRTVSVKLTAQPVEIDLGGPVVRTLAYGDTIPGPLIRAGVGDELVVDVSNRLDHPTSVHWHGIALRNDMDGAQPATPDIEAGRNFTYRFSVPNAGTYWGHPHTGLDEDTGLYLPVIVDSPIEDDYDAEWIVVLDDWTDGVGKNPQELYAELVSPSDSSLPRSATSGPPAKPGARTGPPTAPATPITEMAGTTGGVGTSDLLHGDAGDIPYPYYLINGRIPAAPTTFGARPGQRIKVRLINTGSDTAFRVALAGHSMTVTHTDGHPVLPREVDALLIGMAERYDVMVTAADGVFPLVALAEGKNALARALLVTGAGGLPDPQLQPDELNQRVGTADMFTATTPENLGRPDPDLRLPVVLGGDMSQYNWTINGEPYPTTKPLQVRQGQRPTIIFDNTTMMYHPIHLHGHTFQLINADGAPGARKDTVMVLPNSRLSAVLVADNPGLWQLHCHNTYHQVAGMQTRLEYLF